MSDEMNASANAETEVTQQDNIEQQELNNNQEDTNKEANRTYSQEEVNKIVSKRLKDHEERLERKRMLDNLENGGGAQNVQQQQTQGVEQQAAYDQQNFDPNDPFGIAPIIDKRVEERLNADRARDEQTRLQHEAKTRTIEFVKKLESASQKYQDFQEKVGSLDLSGMAQTQKGVQILDMMNSFDNAGEIAYELAKNPLKLASITTLSDTSRAVARAEMKKLSDSIKQNEESARNSVKAEQPLDMTKNSSTGAVNGNKSVSELRNLSAFKG